MQSLLVVLIRVSPRVSAFIRGRFILCPKADGPLSAETQEAVIMPSSINDFYSSSSLSTPRS
jgi:hypothetical protein